MKNTNWNRLGSLFICFISLAGCGGKGAPEAEQSAASVPTKEVQKSEATAEAPTTESVEKAIEPATVTLWFTYRAEEQQVGRGRAAPRIIQNARAFKMAARVLLTIILAWASTAAAVACCNSPTSASHSTPAARLFRLASSPFSSRASGTASRDEAPLCRRLTSSKIGAVARGGHSFFSTTRPSNAVLRRKLSC